MICKIVFLNIKMYNFVIGLNYFLINYMIICNNLMFWLFFFYYLFMDYFDIKFGKCVIIRRLVVFGVVDLL